MFYVSSGSSWSHRYTKRAFSRARLVSLSPARSCRLLFRFGLQTLLLLSISWPNNSQLAGLMARKGAFFSPNLHVFPLNQINLQSSGLYLGWMHSGKRIPNSSVDSEKTVFACPLFVHYHDSFRVSDLLVKHGLPIIAWCQSSHWPAITLIASKSEGDHLPSARHSSRPAFWRINFFGKRTAQPDTIKEHLALRTRTSSGINN